MKNRFVSFCAVLIVIASIGCEQDRTPFTLEELYTINGIPTKRFNARLNGVKFETNTANGLKTNTALTIQANSDGKTYVLSVSDITEGTYLGNENRQYVFLTYRESGGVLYSTTKQGLASDCEVVITQFDPDRNVVSGNFEGTLYALNGNSQLRVTSGSIIEVPVERPAFGEMTARIDNVPFIAESCVFTSTSSGGFLFETFLGIGNNDSASVSITVEQKIAEQEYNITSGGLTATYNPNTFSSNIFKNQYDGESGKLTITQIDTVNNLVKGSFNFNLRNAFGEPVIITNGEFNALIK